MSASKCPRCDLTVYPVEGLKCLDKVWHKGCFKCHECNMTLSLKNYKGFEKRPYCNAHCPQAKATTVADTPEIRRLAENTRIQSQAKYHEDFEKSKGKGFTAIADDPETVRLKNTSKIISNVAYHGELERKKQMEEMRGKNDQVDLSQRMSKLDLKADQGSAKREKGVAQQARQPDMLQNPKYLNSHAGPQQALLNHQQIALQQQQQQQQYAKDNRHSQQYVSQSQPKMNNNNGELSIQKSLNQYPQSREQLQQQQQQQHQQYQARQQQLQNNQRQIDDSMNINHQMMRQAQIQSNNNQHIVKQRQQLQQQQLAAMRNKPTTPLSPQSYVKYPQINQMPPQQLPPQSIPIQAVPGHMIQMARISSNGRVPVSVQGHLPQMGMPMIYHAQLGPMPNGVMGKQQPYFVHLPPNTQMMMSGPLPQMHPMSQISQSPQIIQQQSQQQAPKRVFRAMYDYVAQDVDEVSFIEGDLLINCYNVDTGWMNGTVQRSGQTGMLPANYVEPVRIKT